MFTGIITDVGEILSIDLDNGKIKISSKFNHNDIDIGASISCSGICLTVVEKDKYKNYSYFCFEVSQETISCTSVKFWKKNTKINLEKSLRFGDEVGGHLVTGHVDCLGEIKSINKSKNSNIFKIKYPKKYKRYVASKGSICLDGISLTINEAFDDFFSVNIIPHTQKVTTWSEIKKNDLFNLEIDLLARYIERLQATRN